VARAKSVICEARFSDAVGLRQDGVSFTVHFLEQEVEAFAHFSACIQNLIDLARVDG